MQCKSLWIKASAKCINVNVNIQIFWDTDFWLALAVSSNDQN